jgi:hypothetical protein
MQKPSRQAIPAGHCNPQPPQLLESVAVSMQSAAQHCLECSYGSTLAQATPSWSPTQLVGEQKNPPELRL